MYIAGSFICTTDTYTRGVVGRQQCASHMPYARLLDLPKNSVTLLHSLVGGNEFTAFVVAGEGADMENVNAIAMLSISIY